MRSIGELVSDARSGAGLSQTELARRAGTSQPALARYERGRALPTLPTLERLLLACDLRLAIDAVSQADEKGRPPTSVRGQLGLQAARLRRQRSRLRAAAHRHGVREIRVFGSVARGDATPDSDIDLLVDLEPESTLLDLAAFARDAETILGSPVDAATLDLMKGPARARAIAEAVLL